MVARMFNKLKVFQPFPWQIAPWQNKNLNLLLTGAAGGGKSRLAGEKMHALMLKYPGSVGVIGRKDRTAAMRSVVPLMLYTIIGETVWGEYHKSEGLFQYHNGSTMYVAGVRDEGQRENLRSMGKDGAFDFAWFEEANKLTQLDDDEITSRMRGNNAGWRQKIYTTNPDSPEHFIKKRLIDGKLAHVYYSRPEDNPTNPADYIEALKNLTGISYQRLYLGLWVQAEGVIYSEYNSSIHLLEQLPKFSHDSRFIITIDFGYTNPFSATLWYISPDNKMYQISQIYKTRTLVEDHAISIKRMLAQHEIPIPRIEAWICDHDAEDRATLERHLNITTRAAYKAVTHGIDAVKSRLEKKTLFFYIAAVANPDLELEKNYQPTNTAEEITEYVWSDKKQDTPIKEKDHGLDDTRYAVAYVDKLQRHTSVLSVKAKIQNYVSGEV